MNSVAEPKERIGVQEEKKNMDVKLLLASYSNLELPQVKMNMHVSIITQKHFPIIPILMYSLLCDKFTLSSNSINSCVQIIGQVSSPE